MDGLVITLELFYVSRTPHYDTTKTILDSERVRQFETRCEMQDLRMQGTRSCTSVGNTSRIGLVPVVAAPPACSTKNAMGAAS